MMKSVHRDSKAAESGRPPVRASAWAFPLTAFALALGAVSLSACVMPDPRDPENPWSVFADMRAMMCVILFVMTFLGGGAMSLARMWRGGGSQ